jgi:eukaryotic-like serine/threonine-protein kinase
MSPPPLTDPSLESAAFRAGALIAGRYELVRKLGAGGMGAVYLARMTGLGKLVALKVFGNIDNAVMRRRFEREAAMALDMSHPGAAQVLDVGEHVTDGQSSGHGFLFIVMEFIEGDDVSTLLDAQGPLGFTDARAIVCSVAQTLAYAHHKGVVHRDIKPANIRVKRDVAGWQVKVLDFGIARIVDDVSTRLTHEGSITGTPRYMAPEQIKNEAVDGRADIYALGLVLFEMLTGRDPFARDTVAQVLWAQMNDALPSISVMQPSRHSAQIDTLLAQATAKEPSKRFASAQAFLTSLDAVVDPQFGTEGLVERRRGKSGGLSGTGGTSGASYGDDYSQPSSGSGPGSNSKAGNRRAISVPVTVGGARQRTWLALGLGAAAVVLAGGALFVALQGRGNLAGGVGGLDSGAGGGAGGANGSSNSMPTTGGGRAPLVASAGGNATAEAASNTAAASGTVITGPITVLGADGKASVVIGGGTGKVVIGGGQGNVIIGGGKAAADAAANAATNAVGSNPTAKFDPAVNPNFNPNAGSAPANCPMPGVTPAIAALSTAQLEARYGASRIMMPSIAARQIKTLQLTAAKYPEGDNEGQRGCILRGMLAQSIEQESVVIATTPSLWGQTRSVTELKKLFMTTPLRKDYSEADRSLLLGKIETVYIANLQKNSPGDGDFWRRMYYGILLNCEATDEARKALGAEPVDSSSCLNLSPR